MKRFFIMLIILAVMAICHAFLLMRISRLEAGISVSRNKLNNIEKEIEREIITYDEKADIEEIANEMQNEKDMVISTDIKYFKVSGNNEDEATEEKEKK